MAPEALIEHVLCIHENAVVLHECAATLQVRHAAEMRVAGDSSRQARAEALAVREWVLADREVANARIEQERQRAADDGRGVTAAENPQRASATRRTRVRRM